MFETNFINEFLAKIQDKLKTSPIANALILGLVIAAVEFLTGDSGIDQDEYLRVLLEWIFATLFGAKTKRFLPGVKTKTNNIDADD